MRQACAHAAEMQPVPDPLDVCEDCIIEGTRWVHLRQCLVCGRTLCCDNSPRRHMTGHWRSVGHPVMKGVSEGDDWTWCFPDNGPIREAAAGGWETYDAFAEAGVPVMAAHIAAGGSLPRPDFMTEDDFPLGDWLGYVRDAYAEHDLDPADVEAIAAIPGWSWGGG
jgi:CPA1 family monovalent cation:H+ antiporter